MKVKIPFLAVLMLSMPAISTEHSDMKMDDMGPSASSRAYMPGMNEVHEKMTTAVKESDPDKASARGVIARHEGAIAITETELKYGKGPEMRKLAEDITKAQKSKIDQMNRWLDNQE